jgi:hypothetical protein
MTMFKLAALPLLGFLCFWALSRPILSRVNSDVWEARLLFGVQGALLALLIAYAF